MREQGNGPDATAARVAARQHGVVSFEQLLAAGISSSGVSRRVDAGRLHRVHRGVYAVGHKGLSNEGRWIAAVLAFGEGAALSHRSAAELWSLLPVTRHPIDVIAPGNGGRRPRLGLRIHRSRSLPMNATTIRGRIAVTTPARTLADLPRVAPAEDVRAAIRRAEYLGLPLGDVVADHTRSELEFLFLRLCRRHRLPAPEVNVAIGPFVVDFLWRRRRLIVETDGYAAHRGRQAFEDDRAREAWLKLRGFDVLRVSHAAVTRDPAGVAATVRGLLG